jgi:hypothetical protein
MLQCLEIVPALFLLIHLRMSHASLRLFQSPSLSPDPLIIAPVANLAFSCLANTLSPLSPLKNSLVPYHALDQNFYHAIFIVLVHTAAHNCVCSSRFVDEHTQGG